MFDGKIECCQERHGRIIFLYPQFSLTYHHAGTLLVSAYEGPAGVLWQGPDPPTFVSSVLTFAEHRVHCHANRCSPIYHPLEGWHRKLGYEHSFASSAQINGRCHSVIFRTGKDKGCQGLACCHMPANWCFEKPLRELRGDHAVWRCSSEEGCVVSPCMPWVVWFRPTLQDTHNWEWPNSPRRSLWEKLSRLWDFPL